MGHLNQPQRIKNIGKAPPERWRADDDGVMIREKLNPIPLNRKFVNSAGAVVQVSLATGSTIRNGPARHWKDNPYGAHRWHKCHERGYVLFSECPYSATSMARQYGVIKLKPGENACDGKFDEEHSCRHVQEIIKARKAAHAKNQDSFARSFAGNQDRLIALAEELVKQNVEAATKPADHLFAKGKK